jgi:ELWxxDGT repeat protein
VSDSTSAGTVLLRDIYSSRSLTILSRFVTTANGMVYFVADDEIAGPELWTSDGTAVGAYLVRDITAGATGTTIANLTAIGDLVYFSATTSARGAEPWCRSLL